MIKRVSKDQVPDEIKQKLEPLRSEVKDYVLIGESYYEVKPFSILKLTTVINELTSLIMEFRKENDLTSGEDRYVSLTELLADPEFKDKFINLIYKLFDGVDRVDLENMTVAQFNELLNTIIKVNMDAFPDENSKQDFITKIVGLIMLVNPNIYRYFMNTQFIDDLNIILQRREDLRKEIDEELIKLYQERTNQKSN